MTTDCCNWAAEMQPSIRPWRLSDRVRALFVGGSPFQIPSEANIGRLYRMAFTELDERRVVAVGDMSSLAWAEVGI